MAYFEPKTPKPGGMDTGWVGGSYSATALFRLMNPTVDPPPAEVPTKSFPLLELMQAYERGDIDIDEYCERLQTVSLEVE